MKRIFSKYFRKILKYQKENPSSGSRRRDMTKLIVALGNFVNAPKYCCFFTNRTVAKSVASHGAHWPTTYGVINTRYTYPNFASLYTQNPYPFIYCKHGARYTGYHTAKPKNCFFFKKKDWFIALRCTNVYMNFPLKLFQIPVYMRLLT